MGLAPQKPRLAGVKLVSIGFFVRTNPSIWIVRLCTMVAEVPYGMHTPNKSGPYFSVIRACSLSPAGAEEIG